MLREVSTRSLDGQRPRLDEVYKDGADRQALLVFEDHHKHRRDIRVRLHLLQAIEPRQRTVHARISRCTSVLSGKVCSQ